MSNYVLSKETRDKLMGVATPTIATALFRRGLRNQFIQDVRPLSPKKANMVGQACGAHMGRNVALIVIQWPAPC